MIDHRSYAHNCVIKRRDLVCGIISRFLTLTSAGQYEEKSRLDNEEPRIKDVLEGLSQLVSRQKASDLLHSMDTSQTVTPKPANNTSDGHFRAGRICVTPP